MYSIDKLLGAHLIMTYPKNIILGGWVHLARQQIMLYYYFCLSFLKQNMKIQNKCHSMFM